MRGDVLLGGCDPVAQRVWTGKHVGAREALAMDMSLHGRCRVQARRPWPNLEDDLAARIPVGRLGEADDVAAAVAFLSSAHASYITGEVVVLNGGWW